MGFFSGFAGGLEESRPLEGLAGQVIAKKEREEAARLRDENQGRQLQMGILQKAFGDKDWRTVSSILKDMPYLDPSVTSSTMAGMQSREIEGLAESDLTTGGLATGEVEERDGQSYIKGTDYLESAYERAQPGLTKRFEEEAGVAGQEIDARNEQNRQRGIEAEDRMQSRLMDALKLSGKWSFNEKTLLMTNDVTGEVKPVPEDIAKRVMAMRRLEANQMSPTMQKEINVVKNISAQMEALHDSLTGTDAEVISFYLGKGGVAKIMRFFTSETGTVLPGVPPPVQDFLTRLKNVRDEIGRDRTGANMPEDEAAFYESLVGSEQLSADVLKGRFETLIDIYDVELSIMQKTDYSKRAWSVTAGATDPATGGTVAKEGDKIRNPTTGDIMVLRNGAWVPDASGGAIQIDSTRKAFQ